MNLELLPDTFSICQLPDANAIPLGGPFLFVGKTDEETSLVCHTDQTPARCLERSDGWRCFRVQGSMDFSLIGIIAGISRVLAEQEIGIFVVSTFRTDYVLVKAGQLALAIRALTTAGYTFA